MMTMCDNSQEIGLTAFKTTYYSISNDDSGLESTYDMQYVLMYSMQYIESSASEKRKYIVTSFEGCHDVLKEKEQTHFPVSRFSISSVE